MKKLLKQLTIFTVVVGIATVIGADAFAADSTAGQAGQGLLDDLQSALNGSIGTTGGLVVSLVGLYMWIWNQASWGIVVAIAGALLTAFPGIYKNIGNFGKSAFSNSIGQDIKIDDGKVSD